MKPYILEITGNFWVMCDRKNGENPLVFERFSNHKNAEIFLSSITTLEGELISFARW